MDTVENKKLDITLKKKKITYLIDIDVPEDTNLINKENEKITKYVPLATEMKDLAPKETNNSANCHICNRNKINQLHESHPQYHAEINNSSYIVRKFNTND